MNQIMLKTEKIYIYASYLEYSKDYCYHVSTIGPDSEYAPAGIFIEEKEVSFEVPDNVAELNELQIAEYRKQQQAIRARAELEAKAIEEKIQNMLCLEAPQD